MPAWTLSLAPLMHGALLLGIGGPVRAPDPDAQAGAGPNRTVVIHGEDERGDGLDAQRDVDLHHPGLATVIDLEHEAGARPSDGLGEVLARAPATTVRSLGGLGQFASVSVRGSSAQQVQLFYEGVPVSDVSAGLSNLADLPLDGVARVEVYRGFVPSEFGAGTMGGAINLVGRGVVDHRQGRGEIAVGSFASRELKASVAAPLKPGLSISARIGYAGSEGSFRFYDNGGTLQLLDDDRISLRRNNDYQRLAAQLRLDGASRKWRWSVQQFAWTKSQGLPGPAAAQAEQAGLQSTQLRTMGRLSRRGVWGPGGRFDWASSLGLERRTFVDPRSELGVGMDDQRTETFDLYTAPALRIPAWRNAFVGVQADLRLAALRVEERALDSSSSQGRSGDSSRQRAQVGMSVKLEQFAAKRRVQVVPLLRIDAIDSRFAVAQGQGEVDEAGSNARDFAFSPRLGLRVRIVEGLSVRASGGRYFRAPTLLELFGDRGFALGREDLLPERGTSVDLGVSLDRAFGGRGRATGAKDEEPTGQGDAEVGEEVGPDLGEQWHLYLQAGAFGLFSRELITWVQAGPIVRPTNLEGARSLGLEASTQLVTPHRYVIAQLNYTFNDTRNLSRASSQNGQALPGRPRHELSARLSGGLSLRSPGGHTWAPRLFVTGDYVAQNFLDPSGRLELPPRALAGLGAELEIDGRVHLAAEVRNVFDRIVVAWTPQIAGEGRVPLPMSDFIGYPLPGRALWMRAAVAF